jgi:PAS domain S-box-containing protein
MKSKAEGHSIVNKSNQEGKDQTSENFYFSRSDADFFLRMIGSIPLALAIFDDNNNFLYVNSKFESVFEFGFEDLSILKVWLEAVCPDREYRKAVYDLWLKDKADLVSGHIKSDIKREVKFNTKSNVEKVIEITFDRVYDFLIVVFEDITEKKNTENKLRRQIEFTNKIALTSPVGILTTECDGTIFFANRIAEHILGMKRSKLINLKYGTSDWKITKFNGEPIEENELPLAIITKTLKPVFGFNHAIELPDGQRVLLQVNASPILLSDDELVGLVITFEDITRKFEAESLMQENYNFRNAIISNAAEGLCVCHDSPEYPYIEFSVWNYQMTRITGYSMKEINKTGWYESLFPDPHMKDIAIKQMYRAKGGDNIKDEEWVINRKDGEQRIITISTSIINRKDDDAYVMALMNDITEKKKNEEEIKKKNQELTAINNTKDRLFSIVAHDLKNPIGVLVGLSELLDEAIEDQDYESVGHYGKIFGLSANKSYSLLVNLLDWARSQSNKISFNPECVLLYEIVEEIKNVLSVLILQKDIFLVSEIDENMLILADLNMLKAILRNLISNAIKYSHRGGTVLIKAVDFGDDDICVSVSDNGIGIKEEVKNSIFDPNEQITTHGTEREMGTGLGLLVCKDFVEWHKGKIWFESTYGSGSVFNFTLSKYP